MQRIWSSLALALALCCALAAAPTQATSPIAHPSFAPIGSYASGLGAGSAETVAYSGGRMFITNASANALDIVDLSSPAAPALRARIDLAAYGAGPNSVAVRGNLVAVAVEADPKTDPGRVVLFNRDGRYLNAFTVGALPDMLAFSPNGHFLLVANEGEPSSDYRVDPEGSVTILPIWQGARALPPENISTATFHSFERGGECEADLDPRTRIFGPTSDRAANPRAVSQNLEPEYIAFSADSRFAYVTLQENNAIGILDLSLQTFVKVVALGEKDHLLPGNGLDPSDRDGAVAIASWPVRGMYMPDAIATLTAAGQTYLLTANEGDARDYAGFAEEIRVGSPAYTLDPTAFPNAAALKASAQLGRLTVTRAGGDLDGDGDYDQIHAFGARSFSVWSSAGELIFDSGDQLERITAAAQPAFFNVGNDDNSFDTRSDNKGPEPEAIAIGRVDGRSYAFIGLERSGGFVVYDVSDPGAPSFVQYANNRDYTRTPPGPDSGPEVIQFVAASQSPTGKALVLVANEISGTVTIYQAS